MMSALVALFSKSKRQQCWRVYVNGIEIDKITPPLEFLKEDDWLTPFCKYVFEERKDWGRAFHVKTEEDFKKNEDTKILEVWFGDVPKDKHSQGYWMEFSKQEGK
jgi:hypothetical protein